MKIKSIHPGATVRRRGADPDSPPLKVGDDVEGRGELVVAGSPEWPTPAVEFEDDEPGRIGTMRIG